VVSADPASTKYWLLHSIEEPAVDGPTTVVTLSREGWSGKLVNTTLLPDPDNLRADKVGGPGKEFWVFGTNYPNETSPPDPETGAWRVELSPARPAAADLFLNVMQVMDRGTSGPFTVETVESRDVVGLRLSDRVVLFNPRGDRTAGPVSFAVQGEGALKLLVTDLAEGTWQVRRDGRIARPAITVSGDSGVMYFEGPAGHYSLLR
jgi:heparin/heparan-sulfate lyase